MGISQRESNHSTYRPFGVPSLHEISGGAMITPSRRRRRTEVGVTFALNCDDYATHPSGRGGHFGGVGAGAGAGGMLGRYSTLQSAGGGAKYTAADKSASISILGGRVAIPRRHVVTASYVMFCCSLLFLSGGLPSGTTLAHRLLEVVPEEVRFTGARIALTEPALQDSEILLSTLKIYGTLALIMFTAYAFLRKRFPLAYNVRGNAGPYSPDETIACSMASTYFDRFTSVSWTYAIFGLTHEEIFESGGLDAVAVVRILELGLKLSLVGMLQSVYLFPVYYWIGEHVYHPATASITDPLQNISLANIPPGHHSAIATTVAAYIFFAAAMYLVLKEFEWFTTYRHRFLSKARADNYTVYVTGIPLELRSDAAVSAYFRECFHSDSVLEAHVALDIPALEKKVTERNACVAKLEHAINVRDVKGGGTVGPTHRTGPLGLWGPKVESIDAYTEELRKLNEEVGQAIEAIETAQGERDAMAVDTVVSQPDGGDSGANNDLSFDIETTVSVVDSVTSGSELETPKKATKPTADSSSAKSKKADVNVMSALTFSPASESRLKHMESLAESVTSSALELIAGKKDGTPRNAAFVTFNNLAATNSALQMIEERPFLMDTAEAARPEDLYWGNIGLSHARKQLGALLGLSLSVLLMLFWTVPVGFVATLSNLSALTEVFPTVGHYIETHPWLANLFAQLAPLFLVVVVAMLPIILKLISQLEGHPSLTAVEASLFAKLSWFTIIQTFFVSAISGSVTKEIQNILVSPVHAVDLLAMSLPSQSAYFMQIMLVSTLLGGVGIELLRVSAVGMAVIRRFIGPNLTEKERCTTWMGLRTFYDPLEYLYARKLGAEVILIFMILFCYAAMAPLTCFVAGFCFLLLASVLRNQFLFIYPTRNDSGGKLWVNFIQIIVVCMMIAQIALIGVLSLKKNKIAAPLLIPLPIITLLFSVYLKQKHYYVTMHLPTKICVQVDKENEADGSIQDFRFVRGKYLQPSMRDKSSFPDNFDEKLCESPAKETMKRRWIDFLNRTPHRKGKVVAPPASSTNSST